MMAPVLFRVQFRHQIQQHFYFGSAMALTAAKLMIVFAIVDNSPKSNS